MTNDIRMNELFISISERFKSCRRFKKAAITTGQATRTGADKLISLEVLESPP